MEGYIKKENRKKILLLSDDFRLFSGVATMSKEIVLGTAQHYNWVQIGAAVKHPEVGKILDLSENVNKQIGIEDSYVKIIPSDGYGNLQFLRQVINLEHPDAVFIFTDPRYWTWLFEAEQEIRATMPLIYLNIWDDLPYPLYNKSFYESCDALLAISKQTENINIQVLGKSAENKIIRYIPHGVSTLFSPLAENDIELLKFKKQIWTSKEPTFKLLYNARNLGRKQVGNLILAWRQFCVMIGKEAAKECELVMHTDIIDNAGTDLEALIRALCDPEYCKINFIVDKLSTEQLNLLYNACDGVILPSSNEGWGLSLTEALNTGKMIIATVTGGMQDQMRFEDEAGNWIKFTKDFPSNHNKTYTKHGVWALPVFPSNRSLAGSPATPYIYDDRCSIEDLSEAILHLWWLTPERRAEYGRRGYEWATGEEAGFTATKMSSRVMEAVDATFDNFAKHPISRYSCTKVGSRPLVRIDYDPVKY